MSDINKTPKEPKTGRDCSHRQLFRPFLGARQYGATTRESSDEKYPRTLIKEKALGTSKGARLFFFRPKQLCIGVGKGFTFSAVEEILVWRKS